MEPTDHPQPDSPEASRSRKSDLSKILLERRRKDRPSNRIPRRAPGALAPLSYAQEQIWFLEQLAPAGSSYHIARAFTLEGPLDPVALTRSLDAVVARHEALRTSFAIVVGQPAGQPVQAVAAELALSIPVLDLRVVPEPAREEEARRLEREEVLRPFDLARGPVLRLTLLRLADERSILLLTLHHIAADGWSLGILLRELGDLYRGFAGGAEPPPQIMPPLPIQYADFALWQRERLAGGVLEKLLAFWRTQLEGAPPVLALPTDRPRPVIQSFRGAGVRRVLPRELAAQLRSFGERERTSPFMALLAAFQALLLRHTGQEDLVVGSPVAGRSRSELEGLIGLFINMLVLRTSLASDPGFRELVGRVREVTLSAYAHQEMPFEKLVTELSPERDLGHAPVFQVIFALQSAAWERLDLSGLALAPREIKREETKVDLMIAIHETGDGLALALQYDRDLFDGTTMARLAAQYEELLSAALADPERPVSGLPALLPGERHQVFHEWNDTGAAYPHDRALPAVFAEQVERSPAEVALICGDVRLTFRELGEQSDRLANHLRLLGVGPEDLVALCLERSPDLIVGLLGILKAGAAYVPLDPESPSERLAWILADTGARLLVTEERLAGLLPDPAVRRVLLDGDRALIAQRGTDPLPNLSGPESLAYVMYTSGSSGRPKGVAVPHRAVARLVRGTSYATFGPGEVFLQLAPVSFDASTFEIWGSLLNGARLVVFPPRKPTVAELEGEIARHGVSTLWLTAGLFHLMLDERPQAFAPVRQMLAGGDVLSPIQSRKFLAVALPGARLINGYGPTEGTTFTCCNPVSDSAAINSSFPIGRPIANTRVYLLDGTMAPVPICVPGELFIGGDGLARGYWNRPDLTAEKFVPDPFGGQPGARLYRSGDLARWLPDGTVDFLGRIDQQVKIRGFRVEPGEIEAALMAEPEVREAVVMVRQEASDQAGDRRLVAYIVGTDADLKERLRAWLPEYMVPAAIVALEALPLSPNGKVDRGALAKLGVLWAAAPEQGYVAPRTALEGELAGMWSSSLGLEKIGVHDNFFELGGNSITGAVLINRLQERLGEVVHVAAIFDAPTVAGLAAYLGSHSPQAVERIWGPASLPGVAAEAGAAAFGELMEPITPAVSLTEWDGASPPPPMPLSFAQERLWFLDQLEPGNPFYNVPAALRLAGALDVAALQRSFDEVVRRHRVLRTRFALVEGAPVQVAVAELRVPLPVVDLAALPEALRERETQRLATTEARRPFDLSQGPLMRTTLLRLESEAHALLLSMHHIVSDGWSMGVLIQELAAFYESSPLPEPPIQYADYAVWQRGRLAGEALDAELAWWSERLAGAPALLEMPTDRPRPAVQSFRGGKVEIALPAALSERLAALSRKSGATLFMVLLAGFDALLSRLTSQLDVVVGSPIAGRNRAELEGLIGFFVNTLVLRTDLAGDPGFAQILERIRQTTVGAYGHQEVPFEKLVAELAPARTLAHSPLFQNMLILQNAPQGELRIGELALTRLGVEAGTSKFDLRLALMEGDKGLFGSIVYNRDLFDRATAARVAACFATLLEGAAADPGCRLSDLPVLSPGERQQVVVEWGAREEAAGGDVCLHRLFEQAVDRAPEAVAMVHEGASVTYRELDRRANQLARFLVASGVVSGAGGAGGARVALCLERSFDMVVAIVGVLKAGAAYVPLDPAYPAERTAFMLADSGVAAVVSESAVAPRTPLPVILLDAERERIAAEPDGRLPIPASPGDWAYVIYTSGSTGRPKGVGVTHANAARLFRATDRWFGFGPDDVWTLFHSYAFDFSVWEIWGALLYGGRLVVVPYLVSRSPETFYKLLAAEQVTVLNQTPSAFRQLIWAEESSGARYLALRYVIFGGEALELNSLAPWFERHGDEKPLLVNMYGITETTVHVTYRVIRRVDVETARGSVIGRPIPDLAVHLLDRAGQPLPLGAAGELHVGGAGVAAGYLGRPELTAARFVPDPFSAEPGARLYRSGDLARFLPDGDLEYLGRIDHQVKVRGFRIELAEIEAALAAEPEVREAVVVVRHEASDPAEDRRLVAYVVGAEVSDLKERLRARLPEYMVPAAIVVLEALPLTPTGKVDRGALSRLKVMWSAAAEQGHVAPRTALEDELARMWIASLGLDQVGVHDDFFELGGNSITGAILINRVQERLGEIVHVVAIFDARTVAGLAAYLGSQYPEAVERIWGPGSLPGRVSGEKSNLEKRRVLGPADAAAFRELIGPLAPAVLSGQNPRAVFLLSPPRSGSTLLRVMLAGHPSLFAPPELELLSFNTMAERREAFSGRDSFWLEGAIRAVMEIHGEGPEKAREWVERSEQEGWTTQRFYRELQELLDGRMLVDKTPSYALDPSILQRAEESFEKPLYIHLLRHPYGMMSSFEEARLDEIFFRRPHPFTRRELAELIWRVSHENVTELLAGIPAERHHAVFFEDLVREPEATLRDLCAFLGLDFDPAMAAPYQDKDRRMTDGLHAESRMLGDVKFHQHRGVEASAAERWRERYREDFLAPETWAVAAAFGYEERPVHAFQPIEPAVSLMGDGASPLPPSFAQERLWFLDQLEPGSSFYNIPAVVRLEGSVDAAALRKAFDGIVRRHRILRTRFAAVQGEPAQVVEPEMSLPLPVVDLAGLPAALREAETRHLANAEARRPFDLSRVPLLRTTLLRLGKEEHALLLCMHHIVSDGWSMGILFQELAALYEYSPLPELPIQYADFAVWQRGRLSGEALEQELSWWRERLAGAPALLELPTDRPRPPIQSFRGGKIELALPRSAEIAALSRRSGTTLFMTLLAAFDALLSRLTGQLDVVVGSPIAGRNRTELEGLIGFFVNTLVLRTDLSGDPGFAGILERVRQATIGAYTHQELPFEKLVGELAPVRTLAHAPLFQVMLVLQNLPRRELRLGGALAGVMPAEERTAKFDLTLSLVERGGGLAGGFQFNSDLFDAATVARFADHFRTLVEGAVADPSVRLSDLPLLSAAARAQLLREWNDTSVDRGGFRSLPERIAEQAARTPETVAVVCGDESLTYAELDRRANRLAWHLRGMGVGPETRVAISMERSPGLLVALLGVLKAGGAYVPIDPSYPEERRAFMLENSGAALVLDGTLPDGEEAEAPPLALAPENLVYVLYTSGSTGRPKGVQVAHGALVNLLCSIQREPGLDATDTVLAVTTLSFDVAATELFLPLLTGARVVLAGSDDARDGAALAALAESTGATLLQATPAGWQILLDSGWQGSGRLRALTAGEALPRDLADRLLARTAALWNLYGPTEATVYCTAEPVLPGDGRITIGRPIANYRLHVLDPDLGLAPVGAVGEIAVSGEGLARGYAGRSDLTAERFMPDPYGRGERLYRTGDLGRLLPDGRLDVLGRIDHQVKVRGFRIELPEVEAALARHPDVREAVVLARDGRLVAFVVANAAVTSAALRAFAGGILPEYMVPSLVVPLPAFPLTPNGKVDRKALAALSTPVFSKEAAAPRSPVEEVAAGIWREVLKVPAVGIDDDFFELGGHSLLATQVVSRAREAFGIELPVRSLFEAKTLSAWARQVARALRAGEGAAAAPIEPAASLRGDGVSPLPLSFAQERLWFLDQLEPGSSFYNIPAVVRLEGALDAPALRQAFDGIVRRHQALRTRFAAVHDEPAQIVEPALSLPLPVIDLAALPAALRETEARCLADAEAGRPFDLSRVPLLRTTLIRLGNGEHALLLCLHHIVSDGWSMGLLFQELSALYERSLLPELPIQYADFAVWQRERLAGEALERELAWWRERLAGAPALLELPTDRPRPAIQSFRGGRVEIALPRSGEIAALARRSGATLFMTLLAAFDALLSRLTGQLDVVVGSPVAGRDRTELEGLIGFFVNTLVLRTDLSGDPGFAGILERVREATLGAYTHPELPFEKLVGELAPVRTLAHAPLFQVMLMLQNLPRRELRLGGARADVMSAEGRTAKFDLTLGLAERGDQRGSLAGAFQYNSDLFDAATVARFADGFRTLVERAVADPAARLSDLPLLSAAARAQLLREWNDTAADPGGFRSLPDRIADQAARRPEAVAVLCGDASLTYAELDRRANRLAWHLRSLGVGPEVRVAISMERSSDLLVALLGVLKAGGAYVPIDPSYPEERRAWMLADSGAMALDGSLVEGDAEAPPLILAPGNLAYVLYTSGSTGRPKGVQVPHGALVNFLDSMRREPGLDEEDTLLAVTTLSFDIAGLELFLPLLVGARVVLAGREDAQDGARLAALLESSGATVLQATPATWQMLLDSDWPGSGRLRALCGGEALPRDLAERLLPRTAALWNLYGPTEATIWCSAERVLPGEGRITIGRPIANYRLHVLDPDLGLAPVGVTGEIAVGGEGLARGYAGRSDLTAERFVPDPFSAFSRGERLYRTGDLGRLLPDGRLDVLGRIDHQVKVRGFRIELQEVEAALARHPDVREAVVLARDGRLVAFVVANAANTGRSEVTSAAVRSFLGGILPEYMVPSLVVALPAFPLTPNGKVDRRALPAPEPPRGNRGSEGAFVPPSTEMEELVARVWAQVLRIERVGAHDRFFDIGGQSLLATQVVSRLRRELGLEIPLRTLFERPRLEDFSYALEDLLLLEPLA